MEVKTTTKAEFIVTNVTTSFQNAVEFELMAMVILVKRGSLESNFKVFTKESPAFKT